MIAPPTFTNDFRKEVTKNPRKKGGVVGGATDNFGRTPYITTTTGWPNNNTWNINDTSTVRYMDTPSTAVYTSAAQVLAHK